MSNEIQEEAMPPVPPELALLIHKHGGEIKAITVDSVMLSEDTWKPVWHVVFFDDHKLTLDEGGALRDILAFYPAPGVPSWRSIAALKPEIAERCEQYHRWRKKNARELAEYRRLVKKFGGVTET